ncbi:xyloglucan:xyloglucosyl transferase [Marchantia polymorpha subsp. ruderalis]|uniref:Xyloglucan endotransglucosylase/hydrolase n=2 Tax=Marchantia polymorpha TaxID=3197 RepID=A0AAF6B536_MARPO|nr:hypothetical protein MARPO_0066s0023 [Marchantia polymorpha]BBN07120.1 hypothetical protein Mp_4g01200 [Marchantia polymorpha subsp. ruderalis]|eukprot:PTQ36064.1 hypothetical protein MARPO_0066s0023 [Marchantia polymorpha]
MAKVGALGLAWLCFALLATSSHADPKAIPIDAIEVVPPGTPVESPPSPPASPPPPPATVGSPVFAPIAPIVAPISGPVSSTPAVGKVMFWDEFYTNFGDKNTVFPGTPTGSTIQLGLDNTTGSGFRSKYPYLYGHLSMKLKLVGGNSAGTVTSYYLASVFTKWCELDFEFLGNVSGQPYILQTNVFSEGKGDREQRIYLWFDPSADYHSYGILWNEKLILFLVDDVVIRVYHNVAGLGSEYPPYLTYQPMYIYSSIWNGEKWATRGGADKTDWSQQPFLASYTEFDVENACKVKGENDNEINVCNEQLKTSSYNDAAHQTLTDVQIEDLRRTRDQYIIYDYCTDAKRFNVTPVECAINWP